MNSLNEPVDTAAEQPRGVDQYAVWYKRYRVSKCMVRWTGAIRPDTASSAINYPQVYVGMTATFGGEAPTTLREAMENPRTVCKWVKGGYVASNEAAYYRTCRNWSVTGVFDCGEVFGSLKEYNTVDDVVGFPTGNPTTMPIITLWIGRVINGAEDYVTYNGIEVFQKALWFGPEKLAVS